MHRINLELRKVKCKLHKLAPNSDDHAHTHSDIDIDNDSVEESTITQLRKSLRFTA
jgi:hypothetical protein